MHKPSSGSKPSASVAGVAAGALLALALLTGCGKSPAAPAVTASLPAAAAMPPATGTRLSARSGELDNPDNPTMVYLYYDLAAIPPPLDQWVEQDTRVRYANGVDKAAQRTAVRAAFEGGLAAVRGVGVIHLTSDAHLSPYDPAYGEFTIGALSPGSVYTFKALDQTVALKFNNALAAQTWSVPKDQAQSITDRYGNRQLNLDTTLKIEQVLPDPAGGTIVARVVSWNLRDARDGTMVGRVKVGGP